MPRREQELFLTAGLVMLLVGYAQSFMPGSPACMLAEMSWSNPAPSHLRRLWSFSVCIQQQHGLGSSFNCNRFRGACAGRMQAESFGAQMNAVHHTDTGTQTAILDGRVLEVRVATADEMTVLIKCGERLPNLLAPLSKLCARVLYGADYLHTAVATDFQSRYGVRWFSVPG